jgi:hypothetical protein
VEPVARFRKVIPKEYQQSLDTRLAWLWNQRFGTLQQVYNHSTDTLDRTAATLLIQAIIGHDLNSIALIYKRLEGGAITDEAVVERAALRV